MATFNVTELIAAFSSVAEICQDMCGRFPKDQMVILKSRAVAEKYGSHLQKEVPGTEEQVSKALKDYTQILLDVSFLEENQLVEDEFPCEDGRTRLNNLLDLFTKPVELVRKVFGDFTLPLDILGKDYVECLHWRQGALLYMYCHTLHDQNERVKEDFSHFLKCLEDGVQHLESMLAVGVPASRWEDDSVSPTDDTLSLIKQGLFSDTHVLALMYAGELCYWHHTLTEQYGDQKVSRQDDKKPETSNPAAPAETQKLDPRSASDEEKENASPSDAVQGGSDPANPGDETTAITESTSSLSIHRHKRQQSADEVWQVLHPGTRHSSRASTDGGKFDARIVGKRMLQRYISVAQGPLRFVGWDCTRAEELLQALAVQG